MIGRTHSPAHHDEGIDDGVHPASERRVLAIKRRLAGVSADRL